jgi:hypothetical protein
MLSLEEPEMGPWQVPGGGQVQLRLLETAAAEARWETGLEGWG